MVGLRAAGCRSFEERRKKRLTVTRSAAEIRREFIEFFEQRGHTFVPGSPVIPYDDPTLLFTNAGMNQFKDVFLGTGTRPYVRAVNSQPCIRAGGKHNDLDDVGRDTYHHTFFEMLGNWSFGDYFKKDAIRWAWELLTEVWGLDKSRLHATYFEGDAAEGLEPDDEARRLWASETDIDPDHIHPGDKKDNFWEMGETGPCGPCSEIHIDLTPDKSGAALVNTGDARVIEIWNLVFIQFNRDAAGKLTPLPAQHVDTGMGFERVTALLQGKRSNYDTDIFAPLFDAIRDVTGAPPYGVPRTTAAGDGRPDMIDVSYRVIADHIRCLTFAINDGCVPDREGRGYVLRRILRRAVRYGWQCLDMHEPFLCKLVPAVVDSLGDAFPKLREKPDQIAEIIRGEEESFDRTLERGIALFERAAEVATTDHHGEIRGEDAFKLHDTYGFPIDLTQIMAEEKGLTVDVAEYERLMEQARQRARAGGKADLTPHELISAELVTPLGATDEAPKYETDKLAARVVGIVRIGDDRTVRLLGKEETLQVGESAGLILDKTCFYAEQGGQIGDKGEIKSPAVRFDVEDTQRYADTIVHFGTLVMGSIRAGDELELRVDRHRDETKHNHTATHLLNWALREVLGDHVQQKGSLVDPDKTRFDFSHPRALTPDEIERVEILVNDKIAQGLPVHDKYVPQTDALKIHGLRAVFGEKYPDTVRVLSIGTPVDELLAHPDNPAWRDVSIEFCGGTHVANTAEIEQFAIVAEEAVAKGIRRVVGVTGLAAQMAAEIGAGLLERARSLLEAARATSKESSGDLGEQIAELQRSASGATLRAVDRMKLRKIMAELQKTLKKRHKQQANAAKGALAEQAAALLEQAECVRDTRLVVAAVPDRPLDQLKTLADLVKQKAGSAAVLFGIDAGGKALLLAAMSNDLVQKGLKAGDLVRHVAPHVKGGGGGPPTLAQAGGKDPAGIPAALDAGKAWIREKLG